MTLGRTNFWKSVEEAAMSSYLATLCAVRTRGERLGEASISWEEARGKPRRTIRECRWEKVVCCVVHARFSMEFSGGARARRVNDALMSTKWPQRRGGVMRQSAANRMRRTRNRSTPDYEGAAFSACRSTGVTQCAEESWRPRERTVRGTNMAEACYA